MIIKSQTYGNHRARADLRGEEITVDKRGRRFQPRALLAEWVSEGDEPLRLLYVSLRGVNVTKGGRVGEEHRSIEWKESELPVSIREWVDKHGPCHSRASLIPS
ncbi:MAG TPA: hypothetical protein VE196_08420 [Pseudonocardiaceae bacterium]|nr:hypothetical protein [Pseudonocardiaceae bacterium]